MLGQLTFTGGDPRPVLRAFFEDVIDFLTRVLTKDDRYWRMDWDETLQEPMWEAWQEARSDAALAPVREGIETLSEGAIRAHGLAGAQLRFKLNVINRHFLNPARGFGAAGFRKLLEALDVLLESLLSAIPAGTAVSEMKDYIGLSVKE